MADRKIVYGVWCIPEIYVVCETRKLAEEWIATSGFPASIYQIEEVEYIKEEEDGD